MESLCGCKIPDGHPLFVLYKENDAISKAVARVRDAILFEEPDEALEAGLDELKKLAAHYEKKSRCLYPAIQARSEAADTVAEMRAADAALMEELAYLAEDETLPAEEWEARLMELLSGLRNMLARENNVLYPLLSQSLTEEEWVGIYFGFQDIEPCMIEKYTRWPRAENPGAPRCACEL